MVRGFRANLDCSKQCRKSDTKSGQARRGEKRVIWGRNFVGAGRPSDLGEASDAAPGNAGWRGKA
ncbi:hypothetical protein GCM10011404_13480 [Sphingomonas prati]|nr:hypothetical protein GCM10011404_13480 [Sphingomonas prati]